MYAENAIREHKQSLNYLTLSARLDAASSRLKSMSAQQKVRKRHDGVCLRARCFQVTKQISGLSKAMESAMKSMDLEQVGSFILTSFTGHEHSNCCGR